MNIQQLRERYAAPEIPKCRVCGGVLTVQRAGGGPTIWGCTGMIDDPTGERNWIYAKGRSCADEHYERSRWSDYRQGGDADVIELIDALEAAERERDELRKTLQATQGGAAEAIKNVMRLQEEISRLDKESQRLSDQLGACDRQRLDWLKRALTAEAETARRDAAAGEPEFYVRYRSDGGYEGPLHKDATEECRKQSWSPLYTAATPAVLPPEIFMSDAVKGNVTSDFMDGANWMREQCLALGAQQQKVVDLPDHKFRECVNGLLEEAIAYAGTQQLRARLSTRLSNFVKPQRVDNAKWEVSK